MNNKTITKKNYLEQLTNILKQNLKNIVILLSIFFLLFLFFQIYSFYISNKIQKNSITFFTAQNNEDLDIITDTMAKLSNENSFYGILSKLELININLKNNNYQKFISLYRDLLNDNNLDSVYKSAVASRASYQLIDLNFDDLSLDYFKTINDFISYINDELNSYKGIKLELFYLVKILELEKNSVEYNKSNQVIDMYNNIINSDNVSSSIKERVNKVHEFYTYK